MFKRFTPMFAAALAAIAIALPAQSMAASALTYTTTLQPTGPTMQLGQSYGSLKLDVSSDGIVQGWYQQQYGNFVPVNGSVRNGTYLLEIGTNGNFQIYATKQADGSLKGTATNLSFKPSLYPPTYSFTAALANPGTTVR